MYSKLIFFTYFIASVYCTQSSEEESQITPSNKRIFNNGQPLSLPQLLGGYNPTTASLFTSQSNESNEQESTATSTKKASPRQQAVQVIQIPNQNPNAFYYQTQPTPHPQVVVIPNKKPKPYKPNKRPTTTVQPPVYFQTQPQTPQIIQVTGKPTTVQQPLYIQTQEQQYPSQNPLNFIQLSETTAQPPIYFQTQQSQNTAPQSIQVNGRPTTIQPPIYFQSQGQQHPSQFQTTAQPPIYIEAHPQQQLSQNNVPQFIQVTGKPTYKPTTVQPPINFQPQQQQNHQSQKPLQVIQVTGHHPQNQQHNQQPPIYVNVNPQEQPHHNPQITPSNPNLGFIQNEHQIEPLQESYMIYPGQLDNPTDYEFNWFINNIESGDYKSHREMRQNDIVRGQYEVLDPDGFIRIVTYTADEQHGFRAAVKRVAMNGNQYSTSHNPFSRNTVNNLSGSITQNPKAKINVSVAPLENKLKPEDSKK